MTPLNSEPQQVQGASTSASIICNSDTTNTNDDDEAVDNNPQRDEEARVRLALYDRQEHTDQLVRCYQQAKLPPQGRKRQLHLITGSSGTGKSALAFQLRDYVIDDSGYFISGKYDQYQQGGVGSLAPIRNALQEYCQQLLQKPPCVVDRTRKTILTSVGDEITLLLGLVPTLKHVLESQQTIINGGQVDLQDDGMSGIVGPDINFVSNEAISGEAQARFRFVVCRFLKAICTPEFPVVLFWDDIQWSSSEALLLMDAILREEEGPDEGFMMLGACRGDEVPIQAELSSMLRSLEDDQVCSIVDIRLSGLPLHAIQQLVSEQLEVEAEQCSGLSRHILAITGGNVFAVQHLLQSFIETGVVRKGEGQDDGNVLVWRAAGVPNVNFDLDDENEDPPYAVDLVELVRRRLSKLPFQEQELLKCMACIGTIFTKDLLEVALGSPVDEPLDQLQRLDLILPTTSGSKPAAYKFAHDKVQQAAMELLPPQDRSTAHLTIGRRLWMTFDKEELSKLAIVVAYQLTQDISLIQEESDRVSVAELCVCAARNAKRSSEFQTAMDYLNVAMELLPPSHWQDYYELSLELHCSQAELAYAMGDHKTTELLSTTAQQHTKSLEDRARVEMILVYSLGSRSLISEAMHSAFDFLVHLEEPLPKYGMKPSKARVLYEFARASWNLSRTTITQILELPPMTNTTKLSAMNLYGTLLSYALPYNASIFALVAFRMVQLTLRYGLCEFAPWAFACYSMVTCSRNSDVAYRYGRLAMRLLELSPSQESACRAITCVWGMVYTTVRPLDECFPHLLEASKTGLATGDTEFAMMALSLSDVFALCCGKSLQKVSRDAVDHERRMAAYGQDTIKTYHLCMTCEAVRQLLGECSTPNYGGYRNEVAFLEERRRQGGRTAVVGTLISKCLVAVIMGDYDDAEVFIELLSKEDTESIAVLVSTMSIYLTGLTMIVQASRGNKRKSLAIAKKCRKKMKAWAKISPSSHRHRWLHLQAEWVAYKGEHFVQKFNDAINDAKATGSLWGEALICERAAAILAGAGMNIESKEFLHRAKEVYEEWGAKRKVGALSKQLG